MNQNRSRDASLLAASALTVMAGAAIAPALPGLERHFEETPQVELLTKLALTLPALAIALSAPLMGWLGDRAGRKPLLIASTLLFAVAGASGLVLTSLSSILAGRLALGLAVAGIMTCITALIAEYFDGPARTKFMGFQMATASFGGLLFLVLGGALADASWRAPFGVYLAAIPVGVLLWFAIPTASVAAEPGTPRQPVDATDTNWRVIGIVSCLSAFSMVAFYMVPTQIPFYLKENVGASGTSTGLAIGCATFFGGIASLLNRRVVGVVGPWGATACGMLLMASGYVVLWQMHSYASTLAALAVAGTGTGFLMPNLSLIVVNHASKSAAGRAAGVLTSSLFLGQFLSPLAFAPVVARAELSGAFGVAALMLALAGIAIALVGPRR